MIDFEKIKNSYVATIHIGMECGAEYKEAKQGNELLHRFCENLVENENYNELARRDMKRELQQIKEMLAQEIEVRYGG